MKKELQDVHALYLSYDGMTDPLGQSQVLPYLKGLSKNGVRFTLISFEKPDNYLKLTSVIEKICADNNIIWIPLAYTKRPPVLSTVYDLYKLYSVAFHLSKKNKFSIVHCRSYPVSIIGSKLSKRIKAKFIFDIRGFWADERIEGGIWNLKNPFYQFIYNYFKRKEKKLFCEADAIVTLTQASVPVIEKIRGDILRNQLLQVIPCCADMDHFNPEKCDASKVQSLREELHIPENTFLLTYLGALSTWYLPAEMMKFFTRLLLKFPDAKFLILTHEPKEYVLKMARSYDINTDHLVIKAAERNTVPQYLCMTSVSIFFIKPTYSKTASSPTKQGELMGMGIPVIANSKVGDTEEIIRNSHSGWICNEFTDEAFDRIIEQLSPKISTEEKQRIRQEAFRYYSLDDGIKKYTALYKDLLNISDDRVHS